MHSLFFFMNLNYSISIHSHCIHCIDHRIGPLIGTVVGGGSTSFKFLSIDKNNSGSFVVAVIAGCYLLALCVYLVCSLKKEEKTPGVCAFWGRPESESRQIDEQYTELHHDLKNYVWQPHRFCSREAFMLWFLYTTAVFAFWSFIGAIIPVGASQGSNDLSTTEVYAVFVYVGITYLAAFGLNKLVFTCFKLRDCPLSIHYGDGVRVLERVCTVQFIWTDTFKLVHIL